MSHVTDVPTLHSSSSSAVRVPIRTNLKGTAVADDILLSIFPEAHALDQKPGTRGVGANDFFSCNHPQPHA